MPTFDIVSETDVQEVDNALAAMLREIGTRFDFKGAKVEATREKDNITILADDDLKLKQVHELLKGHITRRKLDAGALDFGKVEAAAGKSVRQVVTVKQGIDRELAKKITGAIKDSKMKVQASIQGEELRVTGKKIDELQDAIALVRSLKIEQPLQFKNFRD